MAGLPRPAAIAPTRKISMRAPPRPLANRPQSTAQYSRYERPGAISPAESVASSVATSHGGTKRKERDFDYDDKETNINVVVRCRGRNEREVRENSGVVLSTEGVKSKSLELSMGPSALNNKTYHFDKVFSSAADQAMIYDDVVTPILDEMLSGFNCTIFAYGQTGTGKTYTMTGDMNDTTGMLSDAAGIIPRALQALFTKLEIDDAEWSVKCSFIELYNEELRDLISPDESMKLKIYDDNSNKKGHSSTIVQGMEESHIKNAFDGIKLLQLGSHKRQVAATKCNDLSSRSHTVFTVTAYVKRTAENGEDYVSAGKLNLVDLAGSENIQRSGAENKRAAEAGLINKSLLTLGRVINALVDRSSHIPYRESKLTRLLQDSLGGRTKTCIIATVSPAKSNLEETISTLDYAFRAKNIRNKPQINQMINKKTLLKEFTVEIEKLKGELIATRQRNGVYLSNENYEEITTQSESRRILSEEQAAKIETMETNLRNKVQELFMLTASFMNLKKDNEGTKSVLDETKTLLEQTEFVLATTRQSLADETALRKAHQETEKQLSHIGNELISTLNRTVHDVDGLHAKNSRKSELQSLNRNTWGLSQAQVSEVTGLVESRVEEFRGRQQEVITRMSRRMESFVAGELEKLTGTQAFLKENLATLEHSEQEVSTQSQCAKEEMDAALQEITVLREEVKTRVDKGLHGFSVAAERISAEVISELGAFQTQLHTSYSSLGRDFKCLFEDLLKHINAQRTEADALRQQLATASEIVMQSNIAASSKLDDVLREEREQAAADRQNLLAQITNLLTTQAEAQDHRLARKISEVQKDVMVAKESFEASKTHYDQGMDAWSQQERVLVDEVSRSRDALKSKLNGDWVAANEHNAKIQLTTKSVHAETVRIVDSQILDIETQMHDFDDFVNRARSQNARQHDCHGHCVRSLLDVVSSSYKHIGSHVASTSERVRDLDDDMCSGSHSVLVSLNELDTILSRPLSRLREQVTDLRLHEYVPTGETPQKVLYSYPTTLPRTDDHAILLAALHQPAPAPPLTLSPCPKSVSCIPLPGPVIFHDDDDATCRPLSASLEPSALGLREIDVNVNVAALPVPPPLAPVAVTATATLPHSTIEPNPKLPVLRQKKSLIQQFDGRENTPYTTRRRSPRIAA